MTDFLYEKQQAPDSYVLSVTPGTSGLDLTTVASAYFVVLQNNNLVASWDAALTNQTTSTLTLTHVLAANGTDVPERGTYVIYAKLIITASGGTVRTSPNALIVKGEFEV